MSYPTDIDNDDFDEKTDIGFYYNNPGLAFCFMIFMSSFIVGGVLSVCTKTFNFNYGNRSINYKSKVADVADISIPISFGSFSPVSEYDLKYFQFSSKIDSITNKLQKELTPPPIDATSEKEKSIMAVIKNRDSLIKIFKRNGLSTKDAIDILASKKAKILNDLYVGKKIELVLVPENDTKDDASIGNVLKKLIYVIDDLNTLTVTRNSNSDKDSSGRWNIDLAHIEPVSSFKYASVKIQSSVSAAAKNAGISHGLMRQLNDIFSNKECFRKAHSGDSFAIYYKEYIANGKKIKDGEIAAVEFIHDGKVTRIIGFNYPDGRMGYFMPNGMGVKPAFMRYPVKYTRVNSRFSWNRYHPILHYVRPHIGVDLRARAGTPVMASGSGKVMFAGVQNGYGRVIEINHSGGYKTKYAHLLRFSNKACSGCYVKQGDVIGYVGSSGTATAPHLHYEFHIKGVPHDPMRVRLPEGEMIAEKYRKSFFVHAKKMVEQLELQSKNNNTKSVFALLKK